MAGVGWWSLKHPPDLLPTAPPSPGAGRCMCSFRLEATCLARRSLCAFEVGGGKREMQVPAYPGRFSLPLASLASHPSYLLDCWLLSITRHRSGSQVEIA